MKTTLNTVAAIIAVNNGEKYIEDAINSIQKQTVAIHEIIVVDDGSTDKTVQVLKSLNVNNLKIISQKKAGQANALNKGISIANSEFLSFLDADDMWSSNKTALQLATFEHDTTTQLCFGNIQEFISPELSSEEKQQLICNVHPRVGKMRQAMLIKKSVFIEFGWFPELQTMDFIAWYAAHKFKIISEKIVPETVLFRRLHTSNISRRAEKNREIVNAFKTILALKSSKDSNK